MSKLWGRYFALTFAVLAVASLLLVGGEYLQEEPPPLGALVPGIARAFLISLLAAAPLSLFAVWATGVIRRGKVAARDREQAP